MRVYESRPGGRTWLPLLAGLVVLVMSFAFSAALASAEMRTKPPKVVEVLIIGDRVVDIAYNLRVMPKAMSVRGSLWPMAGRLKTVSRILGCPNYTTVKRKETVPKALDEMGLKRVIVEKSAQFCLYKPKVDPVNISKILAGREVTIEYVDFSQGLEPAVRRTAELLGCSDKAEAVIKKYKKNMSAVNVLIEKGKKSGQAVILNGTFQEGTGRSMLRVEAPGGYADRFLLQPLGWSNAGDCFNPKGTKPNKGHYPVKKTKEGLDLGPLAKADPDAIVITGDALAVQMTLADSLARNPDLAGLKAVKNMTVYALPAYVDSSVLEYPGILRKWAAALNQ